MNKNDEKNHGAELAAGVNDTGSSPTETASHTPGPWKVQRGTDLNPCCGIFAEGGPFVAQTVGGNDDPNAHLIAAAPDYHECAYRLAMQVLQSDAYREGYEMKRLVDDVLAVHAKAEGRQP